jgi:hypothetical protein
MAFLIAFGSQTTGIIRRARTKFNAKQYLNNAASFLKDRRACASIRRWL